MSSFCETSLHHITCITSDPQQNIDFYTKVLGLRLVKITVNFDDPGTYHFYFADYYGSPGSVFTTFPWPHAQKGKSGIGEATVTYFRGTLGYFEWLRERLSSENIHFTEEDFFGERHIELYDHDNLRLSIVESDEVSIDKKILGLHGIKLILAESKNTISLLEEVFGYNVTASRASTVKLESIKGVLGNVIYIETSTAVSSGRVGPGIIHHVALRAKNHDEQISIREKLLSRGIRVTGVKDRSYFTSVYFREPGGVLFEVATDSPGFTVDEELNHLGEKLCIPPQHKGIQVEIKKLLPKINIHHSIKN